MLKNQDAVPEPPASVPATSVAQARVTPDELAQALAAIEARRQAEAAHLAGTIPIDQAVSDLHLDSTPDEIWAEVKTQREKASLPKAAPVKQPQQAAPPISVSMPVVRVRHRGWHRLIAPVLVIGVLMSTGVIPHNFTPHGFSPSLLTDRHFSTAAPVVNPLSAVPDGKEVYADDAALIQISEGKPATQITVSENATGNRWNLIKTGGHVYLRGYIESTSSFSPLQGKPLNVYNDDNSGELNGDSTSEVTLRVDNIPLQKSGGDDGYSEVTVPNFQPDPLTTLSPWH